MYEKLVFYLGYYLFSNLSGDIIMNNHKKCCDYSYRFKNSRVRHGLLFIGLCLAFFVFTVFEMLFMETSGSGTFVMISHAEGEATKTDSTQTDSTKKDSTNTKSSSKKSDSSTSQNESSKSTSLIASNTSSTEALDIDATGSGAGYAAILYDSSSGLPTSEANTIAETSEGFIWVGSYSGLIRYDGNSFERIDSHTGITSVVSLFVDSQDRLWIGTNDNGVVVMDKGEFITFGEIEGLNSSSIRSIIEDNEGNIYIATTQGMGYVDKNMRLHAIDAPQLNSEYICELRVDSRNVIYGETLSGAVFTMENMLVTSFFDGEKLGIGSINTILPDPDNPGYVYIGTEESEMYYGNIDKSFDDLKFYDLRPLKYINSFEKYNGTLWVCADNGIGFFNNDELIVLKNIPLDNSITKMMRDYEGNVWFASNRQGIMKIVQNQFTDISAKYNLKDMVVNSTCVYNDNVLLIGTDKGLYTITRDGSDDDLEMTDIDDSNVDLSHIKYTQTLVKLFEKIRIRSIIKDSKNRLWFSTYSNLGLVEYDNGRVKFYNESNGFPSNRVRVVYERKDGSIMVAASGGLVIIKDEKIVDKFGSSSGINNTEILTISEGDNGEMYLGSDGDGIYVLEKNKVTRLGTENGLKSEVILRIKKDEKRGLFWIVTSNSIAYMKDGKITTVENFPYSNNFDMYENSKGKMWVLSSSGIYVVPTEDLIANGEISYVFYNADCGLQSVATANSYSYVDTDGVLYISGSTRVCSVNIEEDNEDISEIKMSVPFVEADDDRIYADDNGTINIPSSVKRLTIYGFVYTYSLKNPKVSYQLNGFDTVETTVDRPDLQPVSYTNLRGGQYTFTMKLRSAMGTEEREIKAVIIKKKSFYEYLWFKIIATIILLSVLAAVIVVYVRKKTAALVKKQEENKLFIREMTEAFAKVIDVKDKYTNGHSTRVAEYTAMLTKELGYDNETVEKYYNIALLHDIGKISIPIEILNKPGKLTDQEFNIIKSHSAQGFKLLKDISIMPELAIGAGAHHERPDGKGYPRGLKGDQIPRVAQIIAVADTFDAMYSDRPYRKRMNFEKAVSIIQEVAGTQLETDVVEAFTRLVNKGEFRAPDDEGGGTTESIDNIHKNQ